MSQPGDLAGPGVSRSGELHCAGVGGAEDRLQARESLDRSQGTAPVERCSAPGPGDPITLLVSRSPSEPHVIILQGGWEGEEPAARAAGPAWGRGLCELKASGPPTGGASASPPHCTVASGQGRAGERGLAESALEVSTVTCSVHDLCLR